LAEPAVERETRTLVVKNVNPDVGDGEFKQLFEVCASHQAALLRLTGLDRRMADICSFCLTALSSISLGLDPRCEVYYCVTGGC